MKTFIIVLGLLISASFALPARATSAFCFNFGHDMQSNQTKVQSQLQILKNAGVKCVRLAYIGWNYPLSEADALTAKSMGFRVIMGGDAWPKISPDMLATYDASAVQQATWAQLHGIDQMSIGNEGEYILSGMTVADWQHHLANVLAPQVKAVYSGVVSYETSTDFLADWQKNGRGSIDMLGWNAYCDYDCNAANIKSAIASFGASHTYVSETNADMNTGKYGSDRNHASEVQGDAVKLLSLGVPIYYFTFNTCNGADGMPNYWGLMQCGRMVQTRTAAALGI